MKDIASFLPVEGRPFEAAYRRLGQVCAALAGMVALLGLVGWATGRLSLAQWQSDYVPMAPSSALGLLLLAAGLFMDMQWPRRRRLAATAAMLVAMLAGLIQAGGSSGLKETAEHLLVDAPQLVQGMALGHMSPLTTVVLLLGGLSLLALSLPGAYRQRADSAGILAAGVIALGAVVLLGYLYGTPLLYGGTTTPMALPTAVVSVLLGVGLLGAAGPEAWPLRLFNGMSVDARMARALVPVMLGLLAVGKAIANAQQHSGINPVLGEAIESLTSIGALGAVTLFVIRRVGRDIERDQAALRSSEDRFRMFYENSPVPFHSLDGDGRLVEVNQAFLDTLGYTRGEVVGRLFSDLMTAEGRESFREEFPKAKQRGHALRVERTLVRKDGSVLNITLSATLARTAEGAFLRSYTVWSDTTEMHKAQLAIAEAKAAAEAATHAKDHLLSTVSHELRTPLTPVLVTLSMLEEDPRVPAALREDITMMRGRIELEARLIDGLLDLTRMTRGKVRLHPELVDAHALLDHALALAGQDADAARPAIQWELKATKYQVWADPTRLQQVCWNILKNAMQYTPDGGRVHIRSRNTAGADHGAHGMLELEVADTGAGIDADFLPHVFDEFERGQRAHVHRSGGLGLGMSIAKSLMEQMGGSILVASEGPGKGATFTVRLPVADRLLLATEAGVEPVVPERMVPEGEPSVANRPLRILLVEDDAHTVKILARILRRSGYDVSTAGTVAEAVASGECERFDLLLSDIGLPDGRGTSVMRWFGKHQPIPGIALSGYAAPEDVQQSLAAGFAMHLFKPIAIGALRAAIEEVHLAYSTKN